MVPDQVEWKMLGDQLNMKFMYHTGKGLSETNLTYIASKLFGMSRGIFVWFIFSSIFELGRVVIWLNTSLTEVRVSNFGIYLLEVTHTRQIASKVTDCIF